MPVVHRHLMPLPLVTSRRLLLATLCRRVSMSAKEQVQTMAAAEEPALVQYYLTQGIFQPEHMAEIKATLNAPLPACFRINQNIPEAAAIKDKLTQHFAKTFAGIEHEGKPLPPPWQLPWYPGKLGAWQLDCGRSDLSRIARTHSQLQEFRDFLMFHTAEGHITRQEAVSMIPALLLDVQPHHRVLDLCAAPGSKTSQVMEALGDSASGFVVANDMNEKRGYMLVHQLQRMGMDSAVVTCHDGQLFPGLYDASSQQLQRTSVFDRVLCDVPCSGDGTIRKNRNLWWRWNAASGLTLHQTQVTLAMRAAALLKPKGLMVYSTCSLNPIENEAVISEVLRRADGALEIVDASSLLPGLITRPGLSSWQVAWQRKTAPKGTPIQWFSDYDDVPPHLKGVRLLKSMFPREDEVPMLSHAMRLFPTDQNTGGFFVTLLRKKHALPGANESGLDAFEASQRPLNVQQDFVACHLCGSQMHTIRHCPLSRNAQETAAKAQAAAEDAGDALPVALHGYSALREDYWQEIRSFYGIKDGFPHHRLVGRSDNATSICLVNPSVQTACLAGGDLKILNTGVLVFSRVTNGGDRLVFRPTEDGLHLVLPFVTKRRLEVSQEDYERMLTLTSSAAEAAAGHSITDFSEQFKQRAAALREESGTGPVLLVKTEEPDQQSQPQAIPVWLGDARLVLLVDLATHKRLVQK